MIDELSDKDIQLVRHSYTQVFTPDSGAGQILYDRLFDLAPALRPLFDEEIGPQADRLVAGLGEALALLHDRPALRSQMERLGDHHQALGVSPETYHLVGAALLHTVKERTGAGCDDALLTAWTRAYAGIAAEMLRPDPDV